MAVMRAKMRVGFIQEHHSGENGAKSMETLSMYAVAANTYPEDGSDEDNTYAKWTPGANLVINIANPQLWGQFKVGDRFYLDFTAAEYRLSDVFRDAT